MRIVVDHVGCEANAICELVAPEIFHVRDDDILHILQPRPPAELHDKAREAVRRCPKGALSIIED